MRHTYKTIIQGILILGLILGFVTGATGCKKLEATDLFTEAGMTSENMAEWSMEICYINETRGTGDKIYTPLAGTTAEFLTVANQLYGASIAEKPPYIFSAEAMCEYKIDLFHQGADTPALTFYYLQGNNNNLLTYVIRTTNEDGEVTIDYYFYTPPGDLATALSSQRINAIVPKDEHAISFVSRPEMISSITEEELEYYRPEAELEDESANTALPFEFYTGLKPEDMATNSQLYSNESLDTLPDDTYLVVAKHTNQLGEAIDLSITEVRYNDYYTLVFVFIPDEAMLEQLAQLGLSVDSAVTMKKQDLPLDRWIVFLNEDDEIVDVIDPEVELR